LKKGIAVDKLKMQSPNLVDANIEKIAALFPNCITEDRDENGILRRVVDFDMLRQELSASLVEGPQERYTLSWPGKNEAILTANAPIAKTLRPCEEESVDFEKTKNIYIEGDNLDALKLLQETYLSKVKMIYIDPPYNTGNDFIYKDNFVADKDKYDLYSGQRDEDGNRLTDELQFVKNQVSNGRFHSDWLSLIYPRLKLAQKLLHVEGVIFISIDDNEVTNLRKICDEAFGTDNFVAQLIWKRRASSAMADNSVSADHDYVLVYQKGKFAGFVGYLKDFKNYSNPDKDPRGSWVLGDLTVGMTAAMRPNQAYDLVDPKTGDVYPFNPNRVWSFIPDSMNKIILEGRVVFPKDITKRPMQKRFQNELKSDHNPFSTLMIDKVGLNTEATRIIQNILGGNIFDYSKPISLLTTLIPQVCGKEDIVLDFFSGSSVTAHAVMLLNAEDNASRKFIMVQLPESCDEKSEAYKAGYKNIAEIGKERIRRAGKKIKEENQITAKNIDTGFRVFKVDTSNMRDVYYTPDELKQGNLELFKDHIKHDRRPEDLLFQVFIDWGLELSLTITKETIDGKTVFFVDTNALIACFDFGITEELVKNLAKHKPLRAVFRDDAFGSDSVKINVEQIFRLLSPGTEVKAI
jgi:adenine-specific DNA-methyltransferase